MLRSVTICDDSLPSGNVQHFANTFGVWGSTNNGDATNVVAIGAQNFNRSYSYDSLNRISSMSAPGDQCSGLSWTTDPWGNRTNQTPTGGTCWSFNSTVGTNNQLGAPYTYDAAGNMIYDGTHSYTYDAENRLTAVDGGNTATYVYDALGHRIQKIVSGVSTQYYYDPSGNMIADYDDGCGATCWNEAYVYINGQMKAEYTSSTTYFVHPDMLGSTRLVTAFPTPSIIDCNDYYPFGELISCGGSGFRYKFTGKERDIESGLDNFGARYNASSFGRFMSPDSPSYSNHKNPQTWNLYAYSLNAPITFRDADGHTIVCANNVQQCQKDAAAATGNADAAARVTTQTTTTNHSFLGLFHWTTTETTIAISGDVNSFRSLSANAGKLADLVASKDTVTVTYDQYARPSFWAAGVTLNGGSTSYTPHEGYSAQAFIDPSRAPGIIYDPDAVGQNLPQATTAEEFGHEVLGHIWGELIGGDPAGTRANMRDSIIGENAVRALDPTRGQKGPDSHHNYNEMPPDPPKPQQ